MPSTVFAGPPVEGECTRTLYPRAAANANASTAPVIVATRRVLGRGPACEVPQPAAVCLGFSSGAFDGVLPDSSVGPSLGQMTGFGALLARSLAPRKMAEMRLTEASASLDAKRLSAIASSATSA
jgi:hypothetical protein